jgi:hypothetical protein
MSSCYNDEKRKSNNESKLLEVGLPRISLIRNMGTLPQCRSFYTSTTRSEAAHNDTGDSSNTTLRQRFRDGARQGAQRGQVMAKKGATTVSAMIRQYGPVFIGTYATVYFTTLGTLFLGIDSGLLDPANLLHMLQGTVAEGGETPKSTVHMVVNILEHYSWTAPYAPIVEKNPHVANLAVAWIAIKFTEPIRLAFTLAIVPRLARYFGFVVKKVPEDEGEVHSTEHVSPEESTSIVSSATKSQLEQSEAPKETSQELRQGSKTKPVGRDVDEARKAQKGSL